MRGQAFIYRPGQAEPEVVPLDRTPDFRFLRRAVGGPIELVPAWTRFELAGAFMPCAAFVNEEGKIVGLPVNNAATSAWDRALRQLKDRDGKLIYPTGLYRDNAGPVDYLVGPVIVITGDDALMRAL